MRQDPESPQSPLPPDFDQMLGEAQNTLQQGMQTLNEWGNQARQILRDRPEVVIASVSIAGFMTGLLLRQKRIVTQNGGKLSANPMVMFVAGALAGFTMGPRVVQEMSSPEPQAGDEEKSAPPARTPLP